MAIGLRSRIVLPDWISDLESAARPALLFVTSESRHVLRAVSGRTGIPVVVIAVLAAVLAWRIARRAWHVVFELALAFGVLFAATKLGLIPW